MTRAARALRWERATRRAAAPPFLPYGRQTIEDDDVAAVAAVLRSDWLTCGPMVERFEAAFAEAVGAAEAVVCSSGTAALHLASLALDLAPGDAVVVPAITFVATANAQRYCGAEVVFADVDPETGPDDRRIIWPWRWRAPSTAGLRPKAVVPVHLNGQVCDMPETRVAGGRTRPRRRRGCLPRPRRRVPGGGRPAAAGRRLQPRGDDGVFAAPGEDRDDGRGRRGHHQRPHALPQRLRRLRTHGIARDPAPSSTPNVPSMPTARLNPWYSELQELGLQLSGQRHPLRAGPEPAGQARSLRHRPARSDGLLPRSARRPGAAGDTGRPGARVLAGLAPGGGDDRLRCGGHRPGPPDAAAGGARHRHAGALPAAALAALLPEALWRRSVCPAPRPTTRGASACRCSRRCRRATSTGWSTRSPAA